MIGASSGEARRRNPRAASTSPAGSLRPRVDGARRKNEPGPPCRPKEGQPLTLMAEGQARSSAHGGRRRPGVTRAGNPTSTEDTQRGSPRPLRPEAVAVAPPPALAVATVALA